MGKLNPFSKPKMPQPVYVQTPAAVAAPVENNDVVKPDDTAAIEAERKRRAAALGGAGNIVSALGSATADSAAASRTKLLGG